MQKLDLVHVTVDQIREIKSEIRQMENMLKADIASGRPKIQDRNEFIGEINKKKKVLKDHTPKPFRGRKKNEAYTRAKKLKKFIQSAMPSKKAYYQPYPKDGSSYDFEAVVKQQMDFQTNKKTQDAVQEYKHLMRRIDPQDPTITNIELLRK